MQFSNHHSFTPANSQGSLSFSHPVSVAISPFLKCNHLAMAPAFTTAIKSSSQPAINSLFRLTNLTLIDPPLHPSTNQSSSLFCHPSILSITNCGFHSTIHSSLYPPSPPVISPSPKQMFNPSLPLSICSFCYPSIAPTLGEPI